MNFRRYTFLIIILGLCSQSINAQINYKDPLKDVLTKTPKRNLGPGAMSGRITSIAVPLKSPKGKMNRNTIYVGAASGGVWKSVNGGSSWKPIFDKQNVQSIGALAVDPNNPDIIWVGTGEGNPRNSHNSGKGIYKSLDGGKTWKCMGLQATRNIHRIVINPQNSNEIFVGAFGSIWGKSTNRGVYRSNDGGKSWERILYTNQNSGCADLIMDPINPNKLFAALYDHERKPWTFRSGGPGSGLYVTYDGGNHWDKLTEKNGIPTGELGRIGLAIPEINPNRVYAIIESKSSGFYRSEDGGKNWKKISSEANAGNRPFYYHDIYAHPLIEDRVFSIWSQVSYSKDAGEHWKILADWGSIHPDHHAFLIHPDDPDYIINGNDGGLNISYDGGKTWRFAENIPIGQFYHIDVDNETPYNVYGGLQDNGSWIGPGYHFNRGPIKNHEWQEVLFGDGFDVAPLPDNSKEVYAMWQGGNVYHINTATHVSQPIRPQHPSGKPLRFNWNAGMLVDPHNPSGIYFGSQYLHHSSDKGKTWRILSPDLTTNDSSKLKQAESGGLTVDATGAENYCSILSIAVPKEIKNEIWVGTDDGNIQHTLDGGKSWLNEASNIKELPQNAWIPYIHVSPNGNEIWVVANNYRQNDWESYVFYSGNHGKNWKRIVNHNRVEANGKIQNTKSWNDLEKEEKIEKEMGYVRCVLPHPNTPNLIFMGTDRGLWLSLNKGKTWRRWEEGFPAVPVSDLKIQSRENDLIIGTFGRGVWVIDDLGVLESIAQNKNPTKIIHIDHTKAGLLVDYIGNKGGHYNTSGVFTAPNKNSQVAINFWLSSEKKKEKCVLEVYDTQGARIRKQHFSVDSSRLHRVYWNMRMDGVRFPMHNTKIDSTLPSGVSVAPGKYKIILRNEGDTSLFLDSTWCEVLPSPLRKWDQKSHLKKLEAFNKLSKIIDQAYQNFETLKTCELNLKALAGLNYATDGIKEETINRSKPMIQTIDSFKLRFMLPKGYRYYEEATVRLNDELQNAWSLLRSSENPGENVSNAIKNAKKSSELIATNLEDFLKNDYQPFIDELRNNALEINWIKPIK